MSIDLKKEVKLKLTEKFISFLKNKAKQENKSLNNYLATIIMKITDYNIPNKTTIKSIEEIKNNPKNLTKVDNVKDYFEKFKNKL